MAKPFRRLVEDLPAERRERIETHTRALIQEYDLLKALRRDRKVSQEQLAELMGIRQASVSKIENQGDMHLSTLRKYIEALGGELEIRVHFDDHDVRLNSFPQHPSRRWQRSSHREAAGGHIGEIALRLREIAAAAEARWQAAGLSDEDVERMILEEVRQVRAERVAGEERNG